MKRRRPSTQMFALGGPPPEAVDIAGARYELLGVFKHDFYAATCLYEARGDAAVPRIVVKFGRAQPFCGLDMSWYGRFAQRHEEAIYRALAGLEGVPRWMGRLGETAYAIQYVDARPLDHLDAPPAGFFDRLRELFDAVHARGVAYGDANKRSNILVTADGLPVLVDFQISLLRQPGWPRPLRGIMDRVIDSLCGKDLYHLYKHKRRLSPHELTGAEEALSRRRGRLHRLHRRLTKPYRAVRRRFLGSQYRSGRLVSPTEHLEDHYQPEKETWRTDREAGE